MKDKKLRERFHDLEKDVLILKYQKIKIPLKKPYRRSYYMVDMEELSIKETIQLLIDYLGVKYVKGKEIKKEIKPKFVIK